MASNRGSVPALDCVDLSQYVRSEGTVEVEFFSEFSGDLEAMLYPPPPGKQPYELLYSDWHHDFGFRRTVVFGEWDEGEDGLSLPFSVVEK